MNLLIQTLQERGMLDNIVPGTKEQLNKETTAAYIGFDPTASSLHIGNLATIMLLKQLQLAKHSPIIVLGGATGMIGDPSGKNAERKLLNKEKLRHHQACIRQQMARFLDFSGPYKARIFDNYDWFKTMDTLSFLRDVGKHISINYMISKESVKNRLETGISYTEFAYQLLQAYDFYHLYTQHGVKMQMGGSDQWGNITTGIEFIRKKAGKVAYALTTSLMVKTDGTKFGKTEKGNLWLNANLTSPYMLYQSLLNTSDQDVLPLIKRLTTHSINDIDNMLLDHQKAPHKRILQKALAQFLTTFIHSTSDYQQAVKASEVLFGNAPASDLYTLGSYIITCLEGIPCIQISNQAVQTTTNPVDFFTEITQYKIFSSKREARETLQAGGLYINKEKITNLEELPPLCWIDDQYLIVQKGKKSFYLLQRK